MATESQAVEVQNWQVSPTELSIFNLSNTDRDKAKKYSAEGSKFAHELKIASESMDIQQDLVDSRLERMDIVTNEKLETEVQYQSYITTSAAYLEVGELLANYNLTKKEFDELFIRLFKTNSDFSGAYSSPRVSISENERRYQADNNSFKIAVKARKEAGDPPSWYKKGKEDWWTFYSDIANFEQILLDRTKRTGDEDPYHGKKIGFTSIEDAPDWFDRLGTLSSPDREEIKKDLDDDLEERDSVSKYVEGLFTKSELLETQMDERWRKGCVRFEKRRRALFPKGSSFAEYVTYLHATENTTEYASDIFERLDYLTLRRTSLNPEASREKAIGKFAEEFPMTEDVIALYFEKKFKEAGLTPKAVLGKELIESMKQFRTEDQDELKKLKESDKKLFNILNFEINPLLRLLNPEEMDYFSEFLDGLEGSKFEEAIWEMAYLVSRNQYSTEDERAKKNMQDIRRFTKTWLKLNWEWAYGELGKKLNGEAKTMQQQQVFTEEPIDETLESEGADVRQTLDEIDRGNLSDWKVVMTTNRRTDSVGLEEVSGETLHDREISLDRLLLDEGQQVSIKNSSVINALDWAANLPDEVFYMMPKMTVNGEEFTKVKRGSVRILLRRDRKNKEMLFFLHQKKAMSYKF